MKQFRRNVSYLMLVVVFLCNLAPISYAAIVDTENPSVETCKLVFNPITADQYSDSVFVTLSAAKRAFGYDYTYYSCNELFMGEYYNCCYLFSDCTKQYFNVIYFDEEILDLDSLTDPSNEIS